MELVIVSDSDAAAVIPAPSLAAVPVTPVPFAVDRATAMRVVALTQMGGLRHTQPA